MDALRANKVRAVLTSIGVIIGSASIVLVVTVALTSQKFVISQIEAMGSNLVWVEMIKTPEKAQPLSYEINTSDLAAAKAQISDALIVAGFNDLPMAVVVGGRTRPVRLIGVTDGYQQIRRLIILRGRYFDSADMEARSKVCLITKDLADRVFGVENPVGRQLRMGELTFTVVGVFRERAETFGLSELQKESVIIPFSLMKYYTGTDVLSTLQLQTGGPDKVSIVEKQINRLLKSRHPVQAEYNVQTLTATAPQDHFAGVAHRTDCDCVHRAADQRHRHHEHHAGNGYRTHPGNWRPQSHRCGTKRDHVAIPD
jgi:putative ABC transport system permease protein